MIDVIKLTSLGEQARRNSRCAATLDAISQVPRPEQRSFAPPPPRHVDDRHIDLVAATLASGMIAAGGKTATAEEAVAVWREVQKVILR